jgi:hypothetical protein
MARSFSAVRLDLHQKDVIESHRAGNLTQIKILYIRPTHQAK